MGSLQVKSGGRRETDTLTWKRNTSGRSDRFSTDRWNLYSGKFVACASLGDRRYGDGNYHRKYRPAFPGSCGFYGYRSLLHGNFYRAYPWCIWGYAVGNPYRLAHCNGICSANWSSGVETARLLSGHRYYRIWSRHGTGHSCHALSQPGV